MKSAPCSIQAEPRLEELRGCKTGSCNGAVQRGAGSPPAGGVAFNWDGWRRL